MMWSMKNLNHPQAPHKKSEQNKNNLLEIFLPFKRAVGESAVFGLIDGWRFTGYTGFASHGAAIAIIIAMYIYSKKYFA